MILKLDASFFKHRIIHQKSTKCESWDDAKPLIDFLFSALHSELKTLDGLIDGIVFCADAKPSWRHLHEQLVSEDIDDEIRSYKGTREKSEDVNWDVANAVSDMFLEIMKDTFGVPYIKVDGAEADDIISLLAKHYTKNGIISIIWSNDGDLSQCVTKKCFQFKPLSNSKKFTFHGSMENYINKLSGRRALLGATAKDAQFLKIKKLGVEMEFIDTALHMIDKIVRGDDGDNIFPIVRWKKELKNGKVQNRKIGSSVISKVYNETIEFMANSPEYSGKKLTVNNKRCIYDDDFIKIFLESCLEKSKIWRDEHFTPEDKKPKTKPDHLPEDRDILKVIELFKSNRKMVMINELEIPESVSSAINEEIKKLDYTKVRFDMLRRYWEHTPDEFTLAEMMGFELSFNDGDSDDDENDDEDQDALNFLTGG